jgi:hypothetical protein
VEGPRQDHNPTQREITANDNKMDDLVFDLYGVSNRERKIIEDSILG